ncbi:C6 zinc finger domain containing protein [Pleurostoma richardsiae]|uniref:C6 zinc finger domain containing protein n=1 Tax=Pleurostoma richardsiae TaxID=41990 RepID=A0AA38RB77_9PEZI|nr:C6 zinc finger domain containing protein [Pleurostoma richardsiae]
MEPLLTNLLSDPLPAMFTMQRHPPPGITPTSPGAPEASPTRPTSTAGPRESASYARRRAGTACIVCRARKTKCDNQRPVCGFCVATGGACKYPDDAASDHSKLDRGSLAILQRLAEVEHNITTLLSQDVSRRPFAAAEGPTESAHGQTPRSDNGTNPIHRAQYPPEDDQPPTADIIFESAEMTLENILRWPVFELEEPPSLVSTLGQVDVARPATGDNIFDVDPEMVAQLVDNFLATNHIKNPIFDVDWLWEQVKDFVDSGLRWNGTTCLVLLICAVSVLSPPIRAEAQPGFSRQPDRLARAEMYFQASQRRIGMVYHENSLLAMQCSFLTAVYLMTTFRILAAWKAFSQAGTQCVGWLATRGRVVERRNRFSAPGLHTHEGVDDEKYVEESLYWSCLKSELELRTELGLPGSSLNEMRYPHLYPSPPGPSHAHMTVPGEGSERGRDRLELGWFFYLSEIALRRIMNDALSSRYWRGSWYYTTDWWSTEEQGGQHFRRHVDEYKQKLDTWYDLLPPPMKFPRDVDEPVGDPLRGILRGHFIDILDVVYFPAVQAVVLRSRPLGALSSCVLEVTREALATAVYRVGICREGFYHRHQGTWLMIRTCSRSALQLLGVAMRARQEAAEGGDGLQIAELLPGGWRPAVASVIELIEYWKEESPELAGLLARLKQLYELVQDVPV